MYRLSLVFLMLLSGSQQNPVAKPDVPSPNNGPTGTQEAPQGCPPVEHSINSGPPYLQKSINADTVAPQGEKDKCECGQSKGPIAAVGVGVGGAWADINPQAPNTTSAPQKNVDTSTPHTTTVRCGENGIFGVLINNELHTVQVTCYEGKNHQK